MPGIIPPPRPSGRRPSRPSTGPATVRAWRIPDTSWEKAQRLITPKSPPSMFQSIEALEAWQAAEDAQRQDREAVRWHTDQLRELSIHWKTGTDEATTWEPHIYAACHAWEIVSGGLLRFEPTVRPAEANIILDWSETPTEGRENEVGHTDRSIGTGNWIIHARVTLLTAPAIGMQLSEAGLRSLRHTTLLHELGHALGLEHSDRRRDVMHHRGWQNRTLSDNDALRLRTLYDQPAALSHWT